MKVVVVVVEVGIDDMKQYYKMMMKEDYLFLTQDVDVDKHLMFDDHAPLSQHVQYFYNENLHVTLVLDKLNLKEDELLGDETRNMNIKIICIFLI
jgi:hypothetical protein